MSVRIETLSAETVTVHRVERGEELVEDYPETIVDGEVALALSYDEVVSIEGTEERVNTLAATMLASVPAGPYVAVRRAELATLSTLAEELAAACSGGAADDPEAAAEVVTVAATTATSIRALLATLTNTC